MARRTTGGELGCLLVISTILALLAALIYSDIFGGDFTEGLLISLAALGGLIYYAYTKDKRRSSRGLGHRQQAQRKAELARARAERERSEREAEERRKEQERWKRQELERKGKAQRQEWKRQEEAGRQELKRQLRERVKREEEEQRQRIEAMLHRDRVRDEINYMSGPEFERFMADLFRQKGYEVEETSLSGDQGVDLILPDLDGKRVVVQLKRWNAPVGNAVVAATFGGMAHYQADEGWIITTSTFTKSARELARSTSVRLIDKEELADWLEGLREEGEGMPDSVERKERRRRRRRRR